jgi:hypothetical protein
MFVDEEKDRREPATIPDTITFILVLMSLDALSH